jgi:hypothetical protein
VPAPEVHVHVVALRGLEKRPRRRTPGRSHESDPVTLPRLIELRYDRSGRSTGLDTDERDP